ncbi:hypothetical protein KDX20_33505 [Burkholderia cenocepacia]|nr:hypothetical protein [Burkholderia cenocepacia]MBR8159338.1 hypothetical protein [Burkholderia cenocepacia]
MVEETTARYRVTALINMTIGATNDKRIVFVRYSERTAIAPAVPRQLFTHLHGCIRITHTSPKHGADVSQRPLRWQNK